MKLEIIDASGPLTLAADRRIYDLQNHNGVIVASVEFSDLCREYILHVRHGLTADEVFQALALMTEMNVRYNPKESQP